MRKVILSLLLLAPLAAFGQSIITVSPQQCVWRAGDDPAWVAPTLDEGGWQPYSQRKPLPGQTRIWIRCHADLSALRGATQPALQVSAYAAYELYLNGQLIGGMGDLRSGNFSMDSMRTFPIEKYLLSSGQSTLALRVTRRSIFSGTPIDFVLTQTLELRSGDGSVLEGLRARLVLARCSQRAESTISYGVIGIVALMLLALFVYDRSRRELLLLSITCLSLATARLNEFCAVTMLNYPFAACFTLVFAANVGLTATQAPFFFVLARRRVPLIFWVLVAAALLVYVPNLFDVLLASFQPVWLETFNIGFLRPLDEIAHMALSVAPFVAFWPYGQIERRMRPLAALCMMWGIADMAWYARVVATLLLPRVPNALLQSALPVLETRGIITECALIALLGLLFREQRQVTRERALLAGEMHAASEIQHMLAPASIDTAPGLSIDVAFRPMREVGGDFYSCRVLPDGRERILVGDVSGKGAAAAMAATLILGAASARDADSPSGLLTHLNRALRENHLSGFATCLCADIAPDGSIVFANAGHPAPYLDGAELALMNGLPLGVDSTSAYPEAHFRLPQGAQLTLLSDGVVEARNAQGELFGFDRTRDLSTQSAESIARAAQAFGQEDDITVLTLTFASAEVLHA